VIDAANAKVGLTQHSSPEKSNSSSQNVRGRLTDYNSRNKRRPLTKTPGNTSTEEASPGSSSEDEIFASPKHILRPPKFDGQSSFETFMAQFSNCAEYNRWNGAQKLAYLRSSLEKEAANVLWDSGKEAVSSFSGLVETLEIRFGGKAKADKHRFELRNKRRGTGETLQSVHSDIRRLAALAYPDEPPEMCKEITCDHFLDAFDDLELVFKIRERQPADLDSALHIALQLEAWTKELRRHQDTLKLETGNSRRARTISAKKSDPVTEVLRKDRENRKKFMGNPNGGTYASRSDALSTYVGTAVPSTPCRPRSASYGNWAESAHPSNGYGNRNSNFYQILNSNPGCFKGGNLKHRVRNCPISSAKHRRPEQQPMIPPSSSIQQRPNDRPVENQQSELFQVRKVLNRISDSVAAFQKK